MADVTITLVNTAAVPETPAHGDHLRITCRFYDHAANPESDEYIISGPVHPFAGHWNFNACWCADLGASDTTPQICQIANPKDQYQCECYQVEAPVVIRFVRFEVDDSYHFLKLDRIRIGAGVGEYRIYTWTSPDPASSEPDEDLPVLYAVNTWADRAATKTAMTLFNATVNDHAGDADVVDVKVSKTIVEHSYFESLTEED